LKNVKTRQQGSRAMTMPSGSALPLRGLRVLEFAGLAPAPFAGASAFSPLTPLDPLRFYPLTASP
jgi:hypothetical protein